MSALKPLRFTGHAKDAIFERILDPEWVELAARKPHWRVADPRGGGIERRYRVFQEADGRVLRVVCLETQAEIAILTAFFDRKARRPA